MVHRELRDHLESLQEQLDDPGDLGTEEIELLVDIHSDIERILEATQEASREQGKSTLRERLRRATFRDGGLTRAMNSLMELLSGMGI